jgi:hypothetical protein
MREVRGRLDCEALRSSGMPYSLCRPLTVEAAAAAALPAIALVVLAAHRRPRPRVVLAGRTARHGRCSSCCSPPGRPPPRCGTTMPRIPPSASPIRNLRDPRWPLPTPAGMNRVRPSAERHRVRPDHPEWLDRNYRRPAPMRRRTPRAICGGRDRGPPTAQRRAVRLPACHRTPSSSPGPVRGHGKRAVRLAPRPRPHAGSPTSSRRCTRHPGSATHHC